MAIDPLEKLLRETDAGAGVPPEPPIDLADRVIRRAGEGRRRRFVAGTAAALLLAVGLATPLWRGGARAPDVGANNAALAAQVAQLQAEADWRAAVVRRTCDLEVRGARVATLYAAAAEPDPVRESRREVELAAGIIFEQGDRLYRESNLPQRAAENYGEVLRLFPTSMWAGLARERLAEIKKTQGELS